MSSVAGAWYPGVCAAASWPPSIPQRAFPEQNNPGTPQWDIFSNVFFNSDNCNWNLAAACGPPGFLLHISLSLSLFHSCCYFLLLLQHQSSLFFSIGKDSWGETTWLHNEFLITKWIWQNIHSKYQIKKLKECFLLFKLISSFHGTRNCSHKQSAFLLPAVLSTRYVSTSQLLTRDTKMKKVPPPCPLLASPTYWQQEVPIVKLLTCLCIRCWVHTGVQ